MKIPSYHILIFTILTKFYFSNFNFPPPSEGAEFFFTFLSNFLVQFFFLTLSLHFFPSFFFSYSPISSFFYLFHSLSLSDFSVSLLYFTLFNLLILHTFTSVFQSILFPHFTLLFCFFILLSVGSSFHSFALCHLFISLSVSYLFLSLLSPKNQPFFFIFHLLTPIFFIPFFILKSN